MLTHSFPKRLSSDLNQAKTMRVLFVTSEFYPLVKTGGLADVSAALPAALAELGIDVRVMVPGYPEVLDRAEHLDKGVPLGEMPGAEIGRASCRERVWQYV